MIRLATAGLMTVAVTLAAAPAQAQQQAVGFNFGYFQLRGQDSRTEGDVLNANRCFEVSFDCEPLLFEVSDFNNVKIEGEYLLALGEYFEVGAGIGYYQRTVPTIYEFLTRPDETEIEQELKLRMVPITISGRWIPTGRNAPVQPYLGAGIAFINWRYSESGEFVDTFDDSIFRATFEDDGTAVAPVFLGGVRAPIGAGFTLGGEIRYQQATGDLSTDFLGDKIDLSGFTYSASFQIRF
jgi:Outer membrane protein beta-barrel domain